MNDMSPWQKGTPMETLKAHAGLFVARHKPLVFGAFGLTKERDIADAIEGTALVFKRGPGPGEIAASAIARRLSSAGGFSDFAGNEIKIPAGHVRCSAFACSDPAAGAALLRALTERAKAPLWVELFEEDETAREAIEREPALAYFATKIAAGSEIKGIYTNAEIAPPALHPAEAASLVVVAERFASKAECAGALGEIERFADMTKAEPWAQHYSNYNKRQSWTAFALRGFDAADPQFIIKPAEMSKDWIAKNPDRLTAKPEWTSAAEHFLVTMEIVRRILGGREADRVRLMRLAPGGELSRHADITDREAGLADGRLARLHLPLKTSAAVVMHGWDKRGRKIVTRFPAGALCYLDQRGPHRVENTDPKAERVHLVIDVRSDGRLRDQIAASVPAF